MVSSLIGAKLGQYDVLDLLGRGGMATVYLGRQASIDRLVAIKVLPPHPGLDASFKERFQLEAKTIGSLQHPNILPLYDYGTQDDVLYLVMAYVEGGSLEDRLEKAPFDLKLIEKYIRAIASGMDYAHSRGIIHRDIKPGNILMNGEHPLLADFGMVKMSVAESKLTGTAIVGTPSYMAPEQGQGTDVDHRIDVYALGIILFEMLTGKQPFSASTPMQMIIQHINAPIPDLRDYNEDFSPDVNQVIQKALAKNPAERYQSAGELAEAFSRAIHKNAATLAQIQKEFPLDAQPTMRFDQAPTMKFAGAKANQETNALGQTIIMRDSTNPLLLLAGFGLIALVIVVVAIVLIMSQNRPADDVAILTTEQSPTSVPTVQASPIVPRAPNFGEVRFSQAESIGDTVNVRLTGVRPPSSETSYAAWLLNTENGELIALGRVLVDNFGEGSVVYTDSAGRMLPSLYNAILVSRESEIGTAPSADIVYSGVIPTEISAALVEILVTSPNGLPNQDGTFTSLLAGASAEARVTQQHAGYGVESTNIAGARSHAEHTINALRGTRDDYNGNNNGENPARGVGVYAFLDTINAALESASNQPNADDTVRSNAEFIRICTENVRIWADDLVELELLVIASEDHAAIQDEALASKALADQIRNGFDLNENGIVEAFEGECGLTQIGDYGLQIAQILILEGDVRSAADS